MEGLSENVRARLPHPEPTKPNEGFRLNVAKPYISPRSKAKIIEAIEKSTVSSASPVVTELESALKEFYTVPFAKACSSGYSALVLALKLANVGKNDEVVVPSFTMVAVVNAVLTVGATPVFVDCEKDHVNPSPIQFEQKITFSTKALVITHTYGVPGDSINLARLCKKRNIVMIEDIAEAIGVEISGQKAGTFGDFACASLYANKIITSGDGGFVLSKHHDLDSRAKSYTNHGFCEKYHFVHLEHSGNYKMSGLQAAFVIPAVQEIPKVNEDRKRISETYRKHLEDVESLKLLPKNEYGVDTPWMFGVLVESKEKRKYVRQELANNRIETRDFFFPLHLQPMMSELFVGESYPNTEYLGSHGFYLPTYYGLEEKDIEFICTCLINSLEKEDA